jgi:fluoride exporter
VTHALVLLGVALAGAVGSVLRHEVLVLAGRPGSRGRARGVAAVNLAGAALLAAVVAAPVPPGWEVVVGVGFCGSLTTFSTWMVEAVLTREAGRDVRVVAAVDLVGQLAVGAGLVLLIAGAV